MFRAAECPAPICTKFKSPSGSVDWLLELKGGGCRGRAEAEVEGKLGCANEKDLRRAFVATPTRRPRWSATTAHLIYLLSLLPVFYGQSAMILFWPAYCRPGGIRMWPFRVADGCAHRRARTLETLVMDQRAASLSPSAPSYVRTSPRPEELRPENKWLICFPAGAECSWFPKSAHRHWP